MALHTPELEKLTSHDGQWLSGKVVQGLQNGRSFGFPTVNIVLDQPFSMEEYGVFATEVLLEGVQYKGMLYVGTRPTLKLTEQTVEIHLFDFSGDCYGKEIRFFVGKKIRSEKNFSSVEELINQLKKDKDEILQIFNL